MAESGYNWDSWQAMQKGSSDWSADALADNATETGDPTSLDGFAACEVGIGLAEDNTGAIDGVVTVYVLGDVDGTNYMLDIQSPADGTHVEGANGSIVLPLTGGQAVKAELVHGSGSTEDIESDDAVFWGVRMDG